MNDIKLLPQNLVNKIAAGEVIDRPSSVVKELIENSIDAQAKNITANITQGGIESIQIIDDGIGMTRENARKSYELHTTSKIDSLDDLNKIFTFGFRGEALASICAISEVTIQTQPEQNQGTQLTIENSTPTDEKGINKNTGTTITVKDIFRHLPARKKFLKSPSTEFRHIVNEFTKFAIAYPNIQFILTHNSKEVYKLSSTEDSLTRINQLFQNFSETNLIPINYESHEFSIHGLVLHPNSVTNDSTKQYLFLNSRYIQERSLSKAAKLGYSTSIPHDKQPVYFINIQIDPNFIDVNIHPRKLEVKISNVDKIFYALKNCINSSIETNAQEELIQKFSSFGDIPRKTEYAIKADPSATSLREKVLNYQPKSNTLQGKSIVGHQQVSQPTFNTVKNALSFTENLLHQTNNQEDHKFFQIFDTYIVIEHSDRLEIIDQHAADERVNFEKITKKINLGEMVEKQNLLLPITIKIGSHQDFELLIENIEELSKFGIEITEFGKDLIKIDALPIFAREVNHNELIHEIIEDLKEIGTDKSIDFKTKIAASVACHNSIRAGRPVHKEEIKKLITDLFECELPQSCPHGRPIIWTLKKYELEKQFKRIK